MLGTITDPGPDPSPNVYGKGQRLAEPERLSARARRAYNGPLLKAGLRAYSAAIWKHGRDSEQAEEINLAAMDRFARWNGGEWDSDAVRYWLDMSGRAASRWTHSRRKLGREAGIRGNRKSQEVRTARKHARRDRVARMLREGLTGVEIARRLRVSERTVSRDRADIRQHQDSYRENSNFVPERIRSNPKYALWMSLTSLRTRSRRAWKAARQRERDDTHQLGMSGDDFNRRVAVLRQQSRAVSVQGRAEIVPLTHAEEAERIAELRRQGAILRGDTHGAPKYPKGGAPHENKHNPG